jgi:hypothetical protein
MDSIETPRCQMLAAKQEKTDPRPARATARVRTVVVGWLRGLVPSLLRIGQTSRPMHRRRLILAGLTHVSYTHNVSSFRNLPRNDP